MAEKLKGFLKDSLLYGIGEGLGRLTNLILLPILSRIFVPEDYGIIDLLTVSYYFFIMSINLNILTGLQKYYYLRSEKERKILVASTLFYYIFGVFLISFLCGLLANKISFIIFNTQAYSKAVILLACCMSIEMLLEALTLILRLRREAVAFSVFNILKVVITTLLTFILVALFHFGINGVFIAKLISLLIIIVPLAYLLRAEFALKFQFTIFKDIVLFSLPGHPAPIVLSIMNILPRYILLHLSSLYAVGLYGIASRIAQFLQLYINAFQKAWNPFAFANAGKPDEAYLYEKIFKGFAASLIFFGLLLSIFAREILIFLTPQQYHSAYLLVSGICVYIGIVGLCLIFSTALYSVNKVAATSYLNIIQIVSFCILSMFLVPRYGATGLIIALSLSSLPYLISYNFIMQRHFKFNTSYKSLITLFTIACFMTAYFNTLEKVPDYAVLLKVVAVLLYAISNYYILLTKEERLSATMQIKLIVKKLSAQ